MIGETVQRMDSVRAERTRGVLLRLCADQLTDHKILALKQLVSDHSGQCKMELQVTVDDRFASHIVFGDAFAVTAAEAFLLAPDRWFAPGAAGLRRSGLRLVTDRSDSSGPACGVPRRSLATSRAAPRRARRGGTPASRRRRRRARTWCRRRRTAAPDPARGGPRTR